MTMSEQDSEFQIALTAALDRIRLVQRIMESLKADLAPNDKKPKRSLYGLWAGTNVSAEDIDEARREMWGNFPREDI